MAGWSGAARVFSSTTSAKVLPIGLSIPRRLVRIRLAARRQLVLNVPIELHASDLGQFAAHARQQRPVLGNIAGLSDGVPKPADGNRDGGDGIEWIEGHGKARCFEITQ